MADIAGVPIAVELTPGQAHESVRFEAVLDLVRLPLRTGGCRCLPGCVAAHKGYSYLGIRCWLRRLRINGVIPRRSSERPAPPGEGPCDVATDLRCNAVERCVG